MRPAPRNPIISRRGTHARRTRAIAQSDGPKKKSLHLPRRALSASEQRRGLSVERGGLLHAKRAAGRLMAASHRFRLTRIRTPNTAQHSLLAVGRRRLDRGSAVPVVVADGSLTRRRRRRPYPTKRSAHRLQSTNASERTIRREAGHAQPVSCNEQSRRRIPIRSRCCRLQPAASPFTNTCARFVFRRCVATARATRVGGDGGSCCWDNGASSMQ